MDGTLAKAVSSGTFTMEVKLDGSTLYSHTDNVCGTVDVNPPLGTKIVLQGFDCPTSTSGDAELSLTASFPPFVPSVSAVSAQAHAHLPSVEPRPSPPSRRSCRGHCHAELLCRARTRWHSPPRMRLETRFTAGTSISACRHPAATARPALVVAAMASALTGGWFGGRMHVWRHL
jgi:hypothetical protein